MIPLRTSQLMLTWFGLLQDENLKSWQKLAYALFSLVSLILIVIHVAASVVFATEFLMIDLERTLYAIYQIFGWSPFIYMSFVTLLLRPKITALIEEVTMISNSIDDHCSKRFILEANEESEWLWKIYIKYGIVGCCICSVVPGASSVLWSLYKYGNFDTEHLYHQFEFTLPWNTQTPLGYFGEILFSIAVCEIYLAFVGAIIMTFVSLCLYHRAFYRIFEYSLRKLNDSENEIEQKKLLCDLIRLHNTAKGLFSHSAEIWSHFVLVVLLSTTLGLACVVFQMDLGLKHMNSKLLFLPIPFIVLNFNIFVYSYFGSMATESYEDMAQALFESNWPGFSVEVKKYFIIMIQNTQKPLYYHGFGIFILSLETYTKLIKTVFSYYMMQKTVTN